MTRTVAISMLAATLSGCVDETCMCWPVHVVPSPADLPAAEPYVDEFAVSDAQEYFLSGLPVFDSLLIEGVTVDGAMFELGGWTYDRARNSVTVDAPLDVETILASYAPADSVY